MRKNRLVALFCMLVLLSAPVYAGFGFLGDKSSTQIVSHKGTLSTNQVTAKTDKGICSTTQNCTNFFCKILRFFVNLFMKCDNPICGDSSCASSETCSSCPSDCGVCDGDMAAGLNVGYTNVKYSFNKTSYDATVYYPSLQGGKDSPADVSGAPYPIIVFAHGFVASKDYYTWAGNHLASHGYVAILFSIPSPMNMDPDTQEWSNAIMGAIDFLSQGGCELVKDITDSGKVGVAGHSKGANGAIRSSYQDSRVKAAVAMAPYYKIEMVESMKSFMAEAPTPEPLDKISTISIPVQLMVGGNDSFCPPEGARYYYDALQSPKEILVVTGANHVGFMDEGIEYEIATLLDGKPGITRAEQERITEKYMTHWFDYFLKGKAESETYLFGTEANKDLTNNVLIALEFRK